MAIEKIVNIVVKDNASVSDKHIKDLDKSLNKLEGSTSGVSTGMKESSLSILENGGAMGLLNDATGGVAMTIKDAVESMDLFSKSSKIATFFTGMYTTVVGASTGAMKIFRLALVGTGIGAIVVGLGLLIANFDKVKQVVFNLVPGLADVADFIGGIIEKITDFVGVTSESERALAKLTEQADKSLAMNKKYLQEEGDQINKYTKAKIEAKNAYSEALKEEGANEVKLRARLNRELLAIEKIHNDDLKKTRDDAKTKADDIAKKNSDDRTAKEKESNDKILAERKAYLEKTNVFNDENTLVAVNTEKIKNDAFKKAREEDLTNKVAIGNQWVTEHRQMTEQEIADAQTVADAKKAIQDGMLNNIGAGLQLLGQLAGKNRALQATAIIGESALGIAKIIINTKAANAAAKLKYALIPGGAALAAAESTMNNIGAGIGIAGNIAATAKALSALKAGGGASGGDGGRGSDGGAPQFNIVGQNSNNQLAQSIGKSQNRPVETFVVSGNVTTAQSLDRNRIATATFNN